MYHIYFASKQLITIFEQKIKDRIVRLWGADKQLEVCAENEALKVAVDEYTIFKPN